jgi:SAM-dependent methyltransferase
LRSQNEIAHFSKVYQHGMYSKVQNQLSKTVGGEKRPVRKLQSGINRQESVSAESKLVDIPSLPDEAPYGYAHRLLSKYLNIKPPDFLSRLIGLSADKTIKVLSLCCGAARTEASYSLKVGDKVAWSLLDINHDLLQMATSQFAPRISVDLIEGNVNELESFGEKWDVIMCVSALHHVVELEKLIKFCNQSLSATGEFWSVGECVGRNGNRLWPNARAEANSFFRLLPERYRLNNHTGQIDSEIPDKDYSVGCFEGIRSEDITSVLNNNLIPVDIYLRNCFLWRLVNLAYSDNYNLTNDEDRYWLQRAVLAEYRHFMNGGQGTELFGVYRRGFS